MILRINGLRVDAHITKPGSRGGHIIAYKNGEPVYGKPGALTSRGPSVTQQLKTSRDYIQALPKEKLDILINYIGTTNTVGKDKELEQILARAPKFKGTVYRGVYLEPAAYRKLQRDLKAKKIIKQPPLTSFSRSADVAHEFADFDDGSGVETLPVVYELESKTGVSVESVGDYPDQQEVLFGSQVDLNPVGYRYEASGGQFNRLVIKVEEAS